MIELDELEFPANESEAHASMLHMAAEICSEGDYEKTLEVIDEVRAQLIEKLMTIREKHSTIPCSPPFDVIMKSDNDQEKDNYFKHG